jgi:hypothetical protein
MSLDVTEAEVGRAHREEMADDEFVAIIKRSLPFGYATVQRLASVLKQGAAVAFERPPHMEDGDRAQVLRIFASTSMREALERHFGIAHLAFQNCHFTGATSEEGRTSTEWQEFTSLRGQVLAQHPDLRDC